MLKALWWLIKLPLILVAVILMVAFGLLGLILTIVGVCLIPVFGVGLLLLPFGLGFLFLAWLIAQIL